MTEPVFLRNEQVTLTVTADTATFGRQLRAAEHTIDAWRQPRGHRRCPSCHPEMAPRPLAVNGDDYRRRQLNRAKRRRR